MTNIKTQIHTNILAKISGSICEKIRAKLSVEAKILGGIIKMDSTKVNAIQTAAINGLQGIYRHKIDSEILNELEVHVFQRMEDRFRAAYADKTLASESDLAKLLIDLETDVVSQVKVALPKIEAKLEVFVDTELKTHIKEIEVEIPLLMSIKIGVDIDVSVTVKASLQLAIQACARANVRILAKALLHGFR
ncbi:uncharacterized protein BYT42DRAFT_613544 [Radiomyces spectabilis]|uniref:uncharacterized protein n=1 Tax=Radiomyces spectabilis TaxID=64574 RepID=UPI00221F425D|nr:uncharacterized protein BYT42DRAFT_613544 [Radiomyces spectabilis]KAI8379218.1 hypothetical protein BYT42DRAFT_613544 [Radiomyces spectabilis]